MLLPFPPDCEGLHLSLSVISTSLSLPLSISSSMSVVWALSFYSFAQRSIFHSSTSSVSSLCHWSSLQISIAVCRWLVICPRVIMNPGQDPDRWPLSPSVSPSLQTWPNVSHSSKCPDIWCFFWQTQLCFLCLQNPNPYNLFKMAKTNCLGPGLTA